MDTTNRPSLNSIFGTSSRGVIKPSLNDIFAGKVPQTSTQPSKGIFGDFASTIGEGVTKGADRYMTASKNKGQEIGNVMESRAKDVIKNVTDIPGNIEKSGGGFIPTIGAVGQAAGHVAGNVAAGTFDFLTPFIPDSVKSVIGNVSDHVSKQLDNLGIPPELQKSMGDVFNALTLKGGSEAAPAAGKITDAAITEGKNIASDVKNGIKSTLPEAKPVIEVPNKPGTIESIQNNLSRGNVPESFNSSIDRLNARKPDVKIGVKSESPLDIYNKYAEQEAKYKKDPVKEDTALGKVGSEELGPAFDNVVKQRRAAGATMEEEMKRVGHIKTDISESFPKFEEELNKSGVTYDAEKGKVNTSKTSKITSEDASLLSDYVGKLNDLGANPTAGELDAFLSRIPNELDVYKSKNNVIGVTNAERMIRGNLSDLSKSLSSKSNPNFSGYEKAKKSYAYLSDFLDKGVDYLGKKTAAGDYSKDASMLKSATQSIINGGKKDWLNKLEALTGRPILDKTMIALQAMEDAGNVKGKSLLDIISEKKPSDIPLSKSGIIGKGIDTAYKYGKEKLVGSKVEQTRRSIQERMNQLDPKSNLKTTSANMTDKNIPISPNSTPFTPKSKTGQMIKGVVDTYKETPNKQGGFVRIGGKTFKEVPEATKKELIQAIDYLRLGKKVANIEDTVSRNAQKFNISQDLPSGKMADRFQDIVEKTKTSQSTVKNVIKK